MDRHGRSAHRSDPLTGALQHRSAQIHQITLQRRDLLQHPQREISRAAPEIENPAAGSEMQSRRLGYEIEDKGRIDGSGLTGFQITEPLDIRIETTTDFFDGGLVLKRYFHVAATLPPCLVIATPGEFLRDFRKKLAIQICITTIPPFLF